MAKNRFIPFGYAMDNGEIIVQENETGFVKIMFEQYARGLSFNEIAGIMNNANIPYNENASIWNKNMVKRIIDNEIYIGNETYPPILSSSQYLKAKNIKEAKTSLYFKEALPYLEIIKQKTFCFECGNKYIRYLNRHRSEKWHCNTNECSAEIVLSDALIISAVIAITNAVIESPSLLEINDTYSPSLEETRLNNEINRELDKNDLNYDQIKDLMFASASKKYDHCKKLIPKDITKSLIQNFHQRAPIDEFDPILFQDTVAKLLIEHSCRIHMQFINGSTISYKQEIRKEQ
jgi:hypothetical protein